MSGPADQPASTLLERYRRLGDEVVGEGVAPGALELPHACLDERVVRRRERQLVDQHALQRVADHVDALPEALRTDQHGTRQPAGAAEIEL